MKKQAEAKYLFIFNDIIERIKSGQYKAGSRVYSENEIVMRYKTSQITARRALSELESAGFVKRIKGKGTFVSDDGSLAIKSKGGIKIVNFILFSPEEIDSSIFSTMKGAQNYFYSRGIIVNFLFSADSLEKETKFIEESYSKLCHGIILFPIDPEKNYSAIYNLEAKNIPFVLIDRACERINSNLVSVDNMRGGEIAAKHLIELGHKSIVFVSDNWTISSERSRFEGVLLAAEHSEGISTERLALQDADFFARLKDLIDNHGYTGIICCNDTAALKTIRLLNDNGYQVPRDVSVTGFDDNKKSEYNKLTTVRQPFERIGEEAARMINQCIKNDNTTRCRLYLVPELVVRGTTEAKGTESKNPLGGV